MRHEKVESFYREGNVFRSLTLAALGIVFGDIGTSPLYAIREAFHGPHAIPLSETNILGVLSLIFWSLILVISVKYLMVIMKADNRGEGGVLALASLAYPTRLLNTKRLYRVLFYVGLFGAALLVGDGVITPAISVLSAVEGLEVATPFFGPYVIPLTVGILAALFINQHHGTARIGAVFGVVVLVWFTTIGALGVYGIVQNPEVLKALSPSYAIGYFLHNGFSGIVVLGAVFLVVTGGEAIYADMGHFGRRPVVYAWFMAAFPGLVLNYFGQGARLLRSPEDIVNPFYRLAPEWFIYPLVFIATLATIIASQAVISGVFSLTRQAIQLGYSPRFRIVHTSSEEIGQIYIPQVNWALFIATCWLVFEFGSSSAIASAYGIAVSATMLITSVLACSVAMNRWNWHWAKVASVFALFFVVDSVFVWANFAKIADGGWVPLTLAAAVFTMMTTWRKGREILMQRLKAKSISFSEFLAILSNESPTKIRGTALFMTGDPEGVPPALFHNVKFNKVLHERTVLMTILTKEDSYVADGERIETESLGEGFYRVKAFYGFMETPDIREILRACRANALDLDIDSTTFYLGRETLIPSKRPGMAIWREHLFAFMSRNSERATAYFNIPVTQVVEIGIQVEL